MTAEYSRSPAAIESEPRRHLTILFTDLSDSTRLSGAMEVEIYAELTHEIRQAFREIVGERGGTVNQFQGDGLQALFGYPQSTEQDGLHATEAALQMHERVRSLRAMYAALGAADLSVHSGIHAGLALARAGDEAAARIELYGPAPGIAKHLSDLAEADEILVSEETLGPGSHLFQTSERRLVTLKGRAEPLAIHRILARTSLRTRFEAHSRRGLMPFVGRHAELQRIEDALDEAGRGRLRFVVLCGAAGVGKTRFAEEFLPRAAAAGFSVLSGYCENELSAQPLQPVLQMLRTQFGLGPGTASAVAAQAVERGIAAIDRDLLQHQGELLRALSIPDGADSGSAARRPAPERTTAALRDLVAALARRQPLVLFVDDWQWVDDATRQVVAAIGELVEAPILLLVATRNPEAEDLHLMAAERVQLDPFDDAEAAATVARLLPGADPFVAAEIRRFSGGNPLFIEELCHSARGAGARIALDPVRRGPAWLETLIESRIARLPAEQREVLDAAAVIGIVVPGWLLQGLTGCGVEHPIVRGLAGLDLVYPGEAGQTLRFKHGITRHVVYETIGLQKRRALHQRVAALIGEQFEPAALAEACETLAYHFAGAAEFAQAARWAEVAGDKAMAASSIDRARAQFGAATEMLDRLPSTPENYKAWRSIVRRIGMVVVFDPSRSDLQIFGRAIERARAHGDLAGVAYAEYWLSYANYALGESRAAVEHGERAAQAAAGLADATLVAQARTLLGQALAAAGAYPDALRLLDEAAEVIRARRSGARPTPGLAYALACKASVLGDRGEFDDAHACFDEALAALPAAGHEVEGSVLCWRSGVHLWQGRWEEARADALAAGRVAERVKSLYLLAMSRALGAFAAGMGRPGERSLQEMADSVSWLGARDKGLFVSLIHGWLAHALADGGRAAQAGAAQARGHAVWTLRRARKRDWFGAAMAMRAIARLDAERGDWPAAQRRLAMADKVAQARGSPHEAACNELCRAQVALAQGVRAAAAAHVERASVAFTRLQMRWHLAEATRLLQTPA